MVLETHIFFRLEKSGSAILDYFFWLETQKKILVCRTTFLPPSKSVLRVQITMSDNGLQEQKGKDIFDNADYGGFHRYLSELALINQFCSMMTRLVWMSLVND